MTERELPTMGHRESRYIPFEMNEVEGPSPELSGVLATALVFNDYGHVFMVQYPGWDRDSARAGLEETLTELRYRGDLLKEVKSLDSIGASYAYAVSPSKRGA